MKGFLKFVRAHLILFYLLAFLAAGSTARAQTINCPTITISPGTLADSTNGVPYSQIFSPTGGAAPYTLSVAGGSLPPGLAPPALATLMNLVNFFDPNGENPAAALTLGNDGNFYGTASQGGTNNVGTVFRVTTNGVLSTVATFAITNGANPYAVLTLAPDGSFYGTTAYGGSYGDGAVFRVTINGVLTLVASFNGTNGGLPLGGLALGSDGNFYGTADGGDGTVFKVTTNGVITTLISFNGTNGAFPQAGLALGNDGNFYGTTEGGGSYSDGTVFKVTTNGLLTALISFNGTNGANPQAGLTLGNDGNFYGTTSYGGSNYDESGSSGNGTVFQVTTNGVLTSLISFNGTNGAYPTASLTLGNDGNFYGTTYYGGINGDGAVFMVTTNGVLTSLASFSFAGPTGAFPKAGLTLGNDGNFYGTTEYGGSNNYGSGYGTIFQMTTNGTLTTLAYLSPYIANGKTPLAGVTLGNDGNFYGTAYYGGSNNSGTVFRVTTNGVLSTLVTFDNTNGANPQAALILAPDGNFYSTTANGGSHGSGTVFRMTTNGMITSLVSFTGANGQGPNAGLTLGNDGNFYGTTGSGGSYYDGTVFKVTTNGFLTSLISFNGTNGALPQTGLTLGNDGNFYGTTYYGGSNNLGAVFQVTTNGLLTSLISFNGTNGANPQAGLTLGNDGNFYGTTGYGGSYGDGTVFQVTTNGVLTVLASFTSTNGRNPSGDLSLGNDGKFYGTTPYGGSYDNGTVFRVTTNGVLTTLIFFNRTNGNNANGGLTLGNDGNLYGTDAQGGGGGYGTIFKLEINSTNDADSITGTPTQPGSYSFTLLATDANGCTGSQTYSLNVDGLNPVSAEPQSLTNLPGTPASFSISVSGYPAPGYQWYFDGVPLDGATGSSYSIASVSPTNAGTYSVVASNSAASVTSSPALLVVGQPPVIVAQPANQVVSVGGSAQFTVVVTGQAPLTYQWLFDQTNVPGATASNLIVSPVLAGEAGSYQVVITNASGSVTSSVANLAINLVSNGGFEAGNFSGWTLSGSTKDESVVSNNPTYVHSGNYGAELGPAGLLGYLSQTIPIQPGVAYLLSFWLDSQGGTPNEFTVLWNGGVLFDQKNLGVTGWTNLQFQVTATNASAVLEFGFRNDPLYFGLDDISVSAAPNPQPGLLISQSGNNLVLTGYNGVAGVSYVLLQGTNLALPLNRWTPVATNVLGTAGYFSFNVTNAVTLKKPNLYYTIQRQ